MTVGAWHGERSDGRGRGVMEEQEIEEKWGSGGAGDSGWTKDLWTIWQNTDLG